MPIVKIKLSKKPTPVVLAPVEEEEVTLLTEETDYPSLELKCLAMAAGPYADIDSFFINLHTGQPLDPETEAIPSQPLEPRALDPEPSRCRYRAIAGYRCLFSRLAGEPCCILHRGMQRLPAKKTIKVKIGRRQ